MRASVSREKLLIGTPDVTPMTVPVPGPAALVSQSVVCFVLASTITTSTVLTCLLFSFSSTLQPPRMLSLLVPIRWTGRSVEVSDWMTARAPMLSARPPSSR